MVFNIYIYIHLYIAEILYNLYVYIYIYVYIYTYGIKYKHNVGRTILNHPPVITINRWYGYHSQMGGLWHCFTHISLLQLGLLVGGYQSTLPRSSWMDFLLLNLICIYI